MVELPDKFSGIFVKFGKGVTKNNSFNQLLNINKTSD